MKGFRTILAMLIAGLALRLFTKYGIAIPLDEQADFVDAGMALTAIVMRLVTTTPAFSSLNTWLKTRASNETAILQRVSPEVVDVLSKAVVAALAQHIKRPLETEIPK